MEIEIEKIISGNVDVVQESLNSFIKNNATVFTFNELNQDLRKDLWKALFTYVGDDSKSYLHSSSLTAIRILSREKKGLEQLITAEYLDLLLQRGNLKCEHYENENYSVIVEALKCLCNIIYQSHVAATLSSTNGSLEGIMNRSKKYKNLPNDVKMFDMKLLFLITALCRETRAKVKGELHGLTYLIEILEDTLESESHNSDVSCKLSDQATDLVCELLKVLFNLTIHADSWVNLDEEDEAHYVKLVGILYKFLTIQTENVDKRLELHSQIVNLLTNMPNKCYLSLFVPVQDDVVPKDMQYEEQNMNAIMELFNFLESRFKIEVTIQNQQELLSPILIVLLKSVNSSRIIRRYLRLKILPPLKDVHNRPEQGSTLRNSLCRLLTTPITNVRDLVADLLFILCKENVGRMIKYTGYGNAAGLFAQRGLLGGGKPAEGRYSSDSEDSDTEEYREYKHGINPVTGCYDPSRPSPTMNMTEEQKEYEAMQLVNLMDNLTRQGIVQPCRIGEDGRPQPIEHVFQLQESLLTDQPTNIHESK
ncbi:hypothetical protein RI129_008122 [Pyrocoelia pectoralis]|uniref:Synembryn-A n=1 Tax=Pyrocoelia pectoralis TaxID=417401 RepID=A0AAN7VAY0_9COLE